MPTRLGRLEFLKSPAAIIILFAATQVAGAQPKTALPPAKPTDVQLAVEKGLFFVEHQSMRWWKSKKCATCHEGQILLVAANVAKSQGVPVDQAKLDFWTERWVIVDALAEEKDGVLNGLGMDTAPFVLSHRDFDCDASTTRAEMWTKVLRVAFKQDDARWDAPKMEPGASTPRIALALASLEESKMALPAELRREITRRRQRIEDWIKSHEPQRPEKTENLAGWVTYEHQRGDPARAKKLLDELLSRRRDDGGWGIKKGDPSHLLITSVVLLALKTSGLPTDNPVVADTQRYLLGKQSEDGRWRELGRHFHPDQYHTAYDAWTTGYAVAALSLTMPKLPPGAKRLFTPDPKLVADVEQLAKSAADGYVGQRDRTGDPTKPEIPKKPAKEPADPPPAKGPKAPEGELRRRAMFGAQFAPVTKEVRDREKLDGDGGVVIEKVFPGTSAADAECKAGDVILAVGGAKVTGIPMFVERVAKAHHGDVLTLDVVRDSVKSEKRVTLKEMPREKGDGYDVVYGSVTSHGARLRTLVTRPKAQGRYPAVMMLQGGTGCSPIDTPVGQPTAFTWIARDLTRHGYVTMRVERPGCGDSEGGPLKDVDFDTELDGLKQALRALKQLDFVDVDNIFLFGHSMGGMMAPLMAVEVPVRGIAFFGTGAGTWFEAVFGQRRRLASLDGTKPAEVDAEILRQARFWYPLVVEKKTPLEILEKDPELRKLGWVTEDKYVGDRHYTFHHQLAGKNLTEAWTKVAATRLSIRGKASSPRVLAIWGTSDWLVDRASNVWIADVVTRVKPGNGTFVALDAIDHFFFRAATPEESYKIWKPAKGAPPGEFNPVILETLRAWLDESAGRTKEGPENPRTRGALYPTDKAGFLPVLRRKK